MRSEEQTAKVPFIYKYLNAYAPVGQETEGQRIWAREVEKYVDQIEKDPYGTVVATVFSNVKSGDPIRVNTPKIVIEAHADEIAWIVTHIEKEGFLRVKRHGGSDNMIAPSKDVVVHTHDGKMLNGVFGWPAIHTRKNYVEEGPDQHELWVDLGLEDKEAVLATGVEVGNLITFNDPLRKIGDYWTGRSLDNKIGGYIIAEVAKRIKERNLNFWFDLHIVNSVQEEVGLYGAKMIAKRLGADLALVHDVCHNTNAPRMNKSKEGEINGGDGPTIQYTAQNHRAINQLVRTTAADNNIPLQLEVGSYGNDTMAFFLENTPTAIISTPLKYMHTTVEMAHTSDVENAIELFIETLRNITPEFLGEVYNKEI